MIRGLNIRGLNMFYPSVSHNCIWKILYKKSLTRWLIFVDDQSQISSENLNINDNIHANNGQYIPPSPRKELFAVYCVFFHRVSYDEWLATSQPFIIAVCSMPSTWQWTVTKSQFGSCHSMNTQLSFLSKWENTYRESLSKLHTYKN